MSFPDAAGQSIGDFRSHQTGDWGDLASWDQWNGIDWVYPPRVGPADTLGDVTIRYGHTITVVENVTMGRNLSVSGTLVSDGIATFEGASTIGGPGNKLFNTIVVRAGDSLTSSANVTIRGDMIIDGAIRFSAGILVFAGDSSTVSGTSTTVEFYALRVDSGALVTTAIPLALHGNLTVSESGRFVALDGGDIAFHSNVSITGAFVSDARVTFTDTTTLTGVGVKSFRHIQIAGTLIPNGAYTISGMLTLTGGGTLQSGSSTTTFAGDVFMLNAGTGTVTFNNFTIPLHTPAFSFTTASDVAILGATLRSNNGVINCSGKTLFGRTGTTRLIGTGSARFTSFAVGRYDLPAQYPTYHHVEYYPGRIDDRNQYGDVCRHNQSPDDGYAGDRVQSPYHWHQQFINSLARTDYGQW